MLGRFEVEKEIGKGAMGIVYLGKDPETNIPVAIKLMDFGIARITDSGITRSGKILGTPSFMSPEQLFGKKVDGRTDLFSLGIMLYELVTGKLPFTGDSLATLMFNIANVRHQSIIKANPVLAEQAPFLSAIIDRALAKNVEDRYQTGAEMVRDLKQSVDVIVET